MNQDLVMSMDTAQEMIRQDQCIIHIRSWIAPYFLCSMRYDPVGGEQLRNIPSWLWIKDQRAFKVHYLDLPTLEAIAFGINYSVRYDDGVPDAFRALRASYLERRDWKLKPLVQLPTLRPLRSYQVTGAQFMFKAKKALNADSMGSGKTAQAIGSILLNKREGLPYKTLVICPSSVKGAWNKEVLEVTNELWPMIMDSKSDKRYDQYEGCGKSDILIMSFDSFIRDYEYIPEYFKPDILIMDEAHRAINRQNKITQILIGGKTIKKTFLHMVDPHSIYLITGTPINNKLEDLYSMLKILDPGIFSWTGFSNRYTIQEQAQRWMFSGGVRRPVTYSTVTGYQNEKELKGKLSLHMIRRTKDEILPELPEKIYKVLDIDLDAEERKIYNDLRKDFKAFVRGKELNVADKMTWMTRASQICNSLETLPEAPSKKSSKLDELVKVVQEHAPKHKIVIFSKYKTMTSIIARELKHLKPLHLNGDTESTLRTEMINDFQTKDKNRVFVATFGAGGVGITLTAADIVILYDMAFTPSANAQAIDQLHRIGQKNSVNIIVMRVRDSVEERISEIVLNKQGIVDNIIGDERATLSKMITESADQLI